MQFICVCSFKLISKLCFVSNFENRDSGVADLGILPSIPLYNVKQDHQSTSGRSSLTITN